MSGDPNFTGRWQVGQRLRVRPISRPGHSRTPGFIEGRVGEVIRDWGDFPNPEDLARGNRDAPWVGVYLLAFDPNDLWPHSASVTTHRVLVDVFSPYLEPV
ncbi:MAG: SH3-like domain-containing protein [Betaproteobacteria bacterium]|nr:nitrile hydratase subunit beta [Betaproteobacteria bacterium]